MSNNFRPLDYNIKGRYNPNLDNNNLKDFSSSSVNSNINY